MNAGTGHNATLANGARMTKITVDAAMIAYASRRSRRPAGRLDRTFDRSSAATSDTAKPDTGKSDMGFRNRVGIATQRQSPRPVAVARNGGVFADILDGSGHGTNRNRQKFYWSFRD